MAGFIPWWFTTHGRRKELSIGISDGGLLAPLQISVWEGAGEGGGEHLESRREV